MSYAHNDKTYIDSESTSPEPVDIFLDKLAAKLSELEAKAARTSRAQRIPPDVPRFVTRW